MRKINASLYLASILILSCFYSCDSPKLGYFSNNSPAYTLNKKTKSTNQEASIGSKSHSSQSNNQAPAIGKPMSDEKINTKATYQTKKPKNTEVINYNAPVSKLSKEEKKHILKSIKEADTKNSHKATTLAKGILIFFAIILPPLAVALVDGITGPFWLSILLTLLLYLPGIIYALYRVLKNRE